jgi:single-stranded-DNA-specific exonuclease
MQKTWKFKEPQIELKDILSKKLGLSSLFVQLLISRGITDVESAQSFLKNRLEDLCDPFLMADMDIVVRRLNEALKKKEPIFIATDFDVDGVTSCAILETELKRLGGIVEHYMPHRVRDGYGLNAEAVSLSKEAGAKIFISLDCGITAFAEMRAIKEAGMDAIIIDHHMPSEIDRPEALAILNPKQKRCLYPFKELASVGLVYKVVSALAPESAKEYLDLVALGTVADVVPLRGENRIFVTHGLDALNKTKRQGLLSLISAAGIGEKKISTHSISFMLAPRLNASGRIDSAHTSLDLLMATDEEAADTLAENLNTNNRQRQKIEEQVVREAMDLIEKEVNFKEDFIIVLSKEDWHPGVLGIVASKIVDRFYRPAVIISLQDGLGRGSARSIHNFHIYEALGQCACFLKEFGGHKYAAGITIDGKNIKAFKDLLNKVARQAFKTDVLAPVLEIDAQIPLSLINEELLSSIDSLSPFGEGNPRPVFVSRGLSIKSKPAVVGKNSLKFWVSDGECTYEAIGFGLADFLGLVQEAKRIDMAYCLGWDTWNANNPIQIEIKDIRVCADSF